MIDVLRGVVFLVCVVLIVAASALSLAQYNGWLDRDSDVPYSDHIPPAWAVNATIFGLFVAAVALSGVL